MATTTIRIEKEVKDLLDKTKKRRTYSDFLMSMLSYFENTKISPDSNIIPPNEVIKTQANRIIEVTRGVEKSQLKYFEAIMEICLEINLNKQQKNGTPIDYSNPESFTLEEVQELVSKCQNLEKENAQNQAEVKRLKNLSDTKTSDTNGTLSQYKKDIIFEVLDSMGKSLEPFVESKSIVKDTALFRAMIEKIRTEISA